jgi:Exo-beta-D-glucosaminidase Ig-fold domain/Concanavalin A-like lectin/glucanases superfamily/Glycosyl hydrolases family 2/Glycosyl hydrolases family 2, sugar binding domain/Glycosyl hydrolases family 2, TIM barrel domain
MDLGQRSFRSFLPFFAFIFLLEICGVPNARAQVVVTNNPSQYGPYNASFYIDGEGLKKPLTDHDTLTRPDLAWSMYGWVNASESPKGLSLIAGVGDPNDEFPRFLAAQDGKLILWTGPDNNLVTSATLTPGKWQFVAVSFDGASFTFYSDGTAAGSGSLALGTPSAFLELAPAKEASVGPSFAPAWQHFGGHIAGFTVLRRALTGDEIKQIAQQAPTFDGIVYEEGSKPWPFQTRQQAGYRGPQDPSTWPKSRAPFSKPEAKPVSKLPAITETGANEWTLTGGWALSEAPKVSADGAAISQPGFDAKNWWPATIPGTVLTTMIDRGVYPDPDYGLNNLAIPESLNKQDYWYRTQFKAPKTSAGQKLTLTFDGINYRAAVWLNGKQIGTITGAFIRGVFDVTDVLRPGETNVLAVRISPPPHPGIPNEQSIKGGPGENGGEMCLDGPTFVATEGWDWVPAIRDRDSGIWQPVRLMATGMVKIGDPQVVTSLPLPDTSRADVGVTIPLENESNTLVKGTLTAAFEGVTVTKELSVAPGKSELKLAPAEFKQLTIHQPRLWWPNGYGRQDLYHLKLTFAENGTTTDTKQLRFGIREITYELSLFDGVGRLRRVEYSPTTALAKGEHVVDVSHNGMREIPPSDPPPPDWPAEWRPYWKSWVASLMPGGESSTAITQVSDTRAAPYLIIKVNGVRIAARGGNWGMDDSRKRVSRERLEPYFRLHRDANVNIIRNWVGQNTEEVFYDLADEYGLLIWNDFWDSTQNYNVEAEDPQLFLDNAHDTILRFRNHPSIAVWCGRNEGVPQPTITDGLDKLIGELDGTRYYSPSSNQVNLQNSGPYKYQDPALYYTTLNHGFSVETGTPSFSTLESFETWIPKADQWPISDDWAYHDWHQSGNGDMAPLMAEMEAEFGAPTSLADFERKVQMLDYVSHRAIFEGMNAHLWAPNSGRMLWMTQPAWPSNVWQILNSDYDTQSSFYAVKKACEPVHVQLDLSNYNVDVVNTSRDSLNGITASANVYGLENKLLLHKDGTVTLAADSESNAFTLDLAPLVTNGVVLIKLELKDSSGKLLSDNLYWIGGNNRSYRALTRLPQANVAATATYSHTGQNSVVRVTLKNNGTTAALQDKLTLVDATTGERILPAYYSDNYVSLLPGEAKDVTIEFPASAGNNPAITLRGWNIAAGKISAEGAK